MESTLKSVSLTGFGRKKSGKVRDYYEFGNKLILITTDRISSFDRVLGVIPYKGQVLNQLSSFWFDLTNDIVPNHKICTPDPNVTIGKKCKSYPIEIVVRGYITGETKTALWYNYSKGKREIYGLKFPDGLKKNQKLPKPIITPTTRATGPGGHDEKISKEEIIERKIVPKDVYEQMEKAALALFKRGTEICEGSGLILVDTKYEFGDYNGELTLIDEIHTPDSSRFWNAETYAERFEDGREPEIYDKDFFRSWYIERGYRGDGTPPKIPDHYRQKLSKLYLNLYGKITGQEFQVFNGNMEKRIQNNLSPLLDQAIIIAGSTGDRAFVRKIERALREENIHSSSYYASAHKQPLEVLKIIERYRELNEKIVCITVAGRSNALSGFVAANSTFPVIACPPFKDKSDYLVNIHSTLQMPSKVPVMTVLEPGNTALAVKRIID